MPEHRLSRLLKTTLLRRASTPSVSQSHKADDRAEDPIVPVPSLPSGPAPQLFAPVDSFFKPRSRSVVSSLPIPSPSFVDEPPPPVSGSNPDPDFFQGQGADSSPAPPAVPPRNKHRHHDPSLSQHAPNPPGTATDTPSDDPQRQQQPEEERSKGRLQSVSSTSSGSRPANSPPQTTPLTEGPSTAATTPGAASSRPSHPSAKLPHANETEVAKVATSDPPRPASIKTADERLVIDPQSPYFANPTVPKRPTLAVRRQSLLPSSQQHLIDGLLDPKHLFPHGDLDTGKLTVSTEMASQRKIWVRRPGGSATLVPSMEDWVVDELRDQILRKYGNSIGRSFDSPDIVIKVLPREGCNKKATPERVLNPEELLSSVIGAYYPGGQTVDEALVVEVPQRRTPKPSPRHQSYYHHPEAGEHGDYFTLVPATGGQNQNVHTASSASHQPHSMSILTTGVAPPLPSPGSISGRHPRRPPLTRHTTNSPTMLGSALNVKDTAVPGNNQHSGQTPPVPAPPVPPPEPTPKQPYTPPARVASPHPNRKTKVAGNNMSSAFGGLIEGTVPPINVLIVEDNIINQKLLEAFMKRLSVRWKCAANGEEAVRKWRQGGFHLVLMDIQLPVMNGLDATKEIRRLERLNGIGVFPKTASGRSSASSANATSPSEKNSLTPRSPSIKEEDTLHDLSLFKSPVIIVALTASSLQSDRHEALAAGCNDFLTKPVGFPWLEQKVTEWGCMQALIDFEGWRKWRGFADPPLPYPLIDHGSPMQAGDGSKGLRVRERSSSPVSPRGSISHHRRKSSGHNRKASNHSKSLRSVASRNLLQESSESTSGGGETSSDSPASIVTTVKIKGGALKNGEP